MDLILARDRLLVEAMSEIGVGGEAVDGLDGEIRVVGDVTGEVVGGELVLRVEAVGLEVLGPLA